MNTINTDNKRKMGVDYVTVASGDELTLYNGYYRVISLFGKTDGLFIVIIRCYNCDYFADGALTTIDNNRVCAFIQNGDHIVKAALVKLNAKCCEDSCYKIYISQKVAIQNTTVWYNNNIDIGAVLSFTK